MVTSFRLQSDQYKLAGNLPYPPNINMICAGLRISKNYLNTMAL